MYLTYEEYAEMGGTVDAAIYPRFEMKARRLIDFETHNRLTGENPIRESVRYCMYELIQMLYADESAAGGSGREIASISNDGVSVAYADAQNGAGATGRYMNHIRTWLAGELSANGVALLYAGVDG